METTQLIYLGTGLAGVVGAAAVFHLVMGRGPRGTLLLLAAVLFTCGMVLPLVLQRGDNGELAREADLLATMFRLAGLIGLVLGIIDALGTQPRQRQEIAEWFLRQPILWGGLVYVNFYVVLHQGLLDNPLVTRYFTSHPVLIITTALFFVALAALLMRLLDVAGQFHAMRQVTLGPIPAEGQAIADCGRLLGQLDALTVRLRKTYLARRLHDAVSFVRRKDSADGLDNHLRHLEENDLANMHAGYAMVRIIVWAIPILGFLGTVVGITMAIANLSPDALEQSMPEVTAGLGVAFDTTALALALVMLLMFTKSSIERIEERLLSTVDARVSEELVGRFQTFGTSNDPNVATIRRMSEQMLAAVEQLAQRQAQLWKATIDEAHEHWAEVSTTAGKLVNDSLTTAFERNFEQHAQILNEGAARHVEQLIASTEQHADKLTHASHETIGRLRGGLEKLGELLVESLHQHGEVLTASERELAQENRRHLAEVEAALGEAMVVAADRQEQLIKQSEKLLKEMQAALVDAAGTTARQQEQLVKQSDVLLRVVDATGQVKELENSLNENLAAIQQSADFAELVGRLSAVVEILSARLGYVPPASQTPSTGSGPPATHAA